MHTSVRRIALAALALPLLLAGCADDDPVPRIPDASTPSASVTETSDPDDPDDPVEPTLPPEAEGKGNEAAEAFVRYYYDAVNYAQATGETSGLAELGLESCTACNGGLQFIHALYERGGTNRGGEYTLTSSEVKGRSEVSSTVESVDLEVVTAHTRQEVTGAGDMDRVYEAGESTQNFRLIHDPTGWHVASWSVN